MQNPGTPDSKSFHSHTNSRGSPHSKASPKAVQKSIASERMDPKILDSRIRSLISGAKDKLQRLTSEVSGLHKEAGDLQESLELSNQQKADLIKKEEDHKAKLAEVKKENDDLLAKRNDLDQKILRAKDQLQELIKQHNQSVKAYTVKLNQMNTKERQEVLKREETKANIDQQTAQVKRDNEELRTAIAECMKKVEAMKEIITQSHEIEQRRLEGLSKEAAELEALISGNNL